MKTDPEKHEIIEDWSEVDAAIATGKEREARQFDADIEEQLVPVKSQSQLDMARADAERMRGVGDRRLRTGGAALAGMTGIAAIIAAASLWRKPEIVHDVKVVEQVKVEKVEAPKIVEVPKIVESTKVIEHERPAPINHQPAPTPITPKPAPTPAAARDIAPPVPGQHMSSQEFQSRPDFQEAEKHGIIQSIRGGHIKFTNGQAYLNVDDNERETGWTTTRFDGVPAYCRATGRPAPHHPGKQFFDCYALKDGRVELMDIGADGTTTAGRDPLGSLLE
jgi:hypothetical protein